MFSAFSVNATPRMLWAAPFCLHDTSSGAALQVKAMFEQLTKRGVRCHVVSALTFDSQNGTAAFPELEKQLEGQEATWFNLEDKGVTYTYLKTKSYSSSDMTRAEESTFYQGFHFALNDFKPDVVFLYGGSPLEMSIVTECKRRGISVVMGVYNGNYANYHFPGVDMLFTDSALSAQKYYKNSKVNILPTGIFIYPEKVVSAQKEPKYITFINPSPAKGISLVLRLALMAQKRNPHWQFLVVESRGTFANALAIYKQKPKNFANVDIAKHTTDIRLVFEKTKILLAPSLWYEGFGRVACEALMNGIPVISSVSGGLPATVNGGGVCLNAPEKCVNDFMYFPTEKELAKWYEALEAMVDEYPSWCEKAKEASEIHNIEVSTDKTLEYLAPLFAKRPSLHPQYFIK